MEFPLPDSAATQGTCTTMALSPGVRTREEIEELVAKRVKEQKGMIMPRLRDRVSQPFTSEILSVMAPPHV